MFLILLLPAVVSHIYDHSEWELVLCNRLIFVGSKKWRDFLVIANLEIWVFLRLELFLSQLLTQEGLRTLPTFRSVQVQ